MAAVVQGMKEEQVRSVVYFVLQENKTSRYEWLSSANLLERITKVDERVASLSERAVGVESDLIARYHSQNRGLVNPDVVNLSEVDFALLAEASGALGEKCTSARELHDIISKYGNEFPLLIDTNAVYDDRFQISF